MSNLKKIGNKLFKEATELKSHNVELALVDDLIKNVDKGLQEGKGMKKFADKMSQINSDISNLEQEIISKIKEYNVSIDSFNTTRNSVVAFWTRASRQYEKIVNTSSDLGVSYPSRVDSSFTELDRLYNFQKNSYAKGNIKNKKLPKF